MPERETWPAADCGRRRDRLVLLATGDAEREERQGLEAHARTCPTCRFALEEARAFAAELEAYLGRFRGRPPLLAAPPRERWWLGIAVAAGILAAAAILLWRAL